MPLTKEQIVEAVRKLGPWFHKIDLPYGLSTKTSSYTGEDASHPLPTWEHVGRALPADLAGRSVLDIGCNAGFYAFEARKRGAARVLGVDARRWHVRQAQFVARANGVDRVKFERRSLYQLEPRTMGRFDVVLALGLVYHIKYLILGLEQLFHITGDLLVLESAIMNEEMQGRTFTSQLGVEHKTFHPLLYVRNSPAECEPAGNWFIPTTRTLEAMLSDVGFVDVTACGEFNGRTLLTARKPAAPPDSTRPVWLRATMAAEPARPSVAAGAPLTLRVVLENAGRSTWLAKGVDAKDRGAVHLCGQWTSAEDELFAMDLPRVVLPRDIAPGERCEVTLTTTAPATPGCYVVELDLVAEHVVYFQDVGSDPLAVEVEVK